MKTTMRPSSRRTSRVAALALAGPAFAALGWALPATSWAQDPAAADALFQEGRALGEAGRWAEACDKLSASFDADATIGTALNLGECSERQGKVGSAFRWFTRAKAMCEAAHDARAELAEERRAQLEPRVPRIVVRSTTRASLDVLFDGAPLDVAVVTSEPGYESLVDPGEHRVEVRRDGDVLTSKKTTVDEGARARIELDLAEIERSHPVEVAPPPPPPEPPPSQVPRYIGWALVGTGGVALVGATILEIAALGAQSDAERPGHCRGTLCTPTGADEAATAGDLAEAGQWVGVAGLGLLAVGVTLVIATPSAKPSSGSGRSPSPAAAPPTMPRAELGLRAGPGRLSIAGSF